MQNRKNEILVVPLGPDDGSLLTLGACEAIRQAGRVIVRTARHAALRLPQFEGVRFESLDALYDCLGELPTGVQICLLNEARIRENLGDYGEKLIDTFRDAADQVAAFTLQEQEDS